MRKYMFDLKRILCGVQNGGKTWIGALPRDISGITLKAALNTIQSINQSDVYFAHNITSKKHHLGFTIDVSSFSYF